MIPFGWVIEAPRLGDSADRIGRHKPALIGGSLPMLVATATLVYLPHGVPPYLLGLLL